MQAQTTTSLGAVKQGDTWGYIDESGKLVIPFVYQEVGPFSEGLAPARGNGLWGYIDTKNALKIHAVFATASPFYERRALVSIQGPTDEKPALGFIDRLGNTIVDLNEGVSPVGYGGKMVTIYGKDASGNYGFGYLDSTGNEAITPRYDVALPFHESLAVVGLSDKYGYIKMTGDFAIFPKYEDANSFFEGLAVVKEEGVSKVIDKEGKVVFANKEKLDLGYRYSEGLLPAMSDKYIGYINAKGKWEVKWKKSKVPKISTLDCLGDFHNGVARVAQFQEGTDTKLFGFVDKKGKTIVELKHEQATSFAEERAFVFQRDEAGKLKGALIDTKGKLLTGYIFDDAYEFSAVGGSSR